MRFSKSVSVAVIKGRVNVNFCQTIVAVVRVNGVSTKYDSGISYSETEAINALRHQLEALDEEIQDSEIRDFDDRATANAFIQAAHDALAAFENAR